MDKREDALEVKLREFIRLLRNHFPIEAVVLFGSHANGHPTHSSDIDVAVFSDAFGKNPLQEMASLCKLRRKIDTDIEPLPFHSRDLHENSGAFFVQEILNQGKVLYKDGHLFI